VVGSPPTNDIMWSGHSQDVQDFAAATQHVGVPVTRAYSLSDLDLAIAARQAQGCNDITVMLSGEAAPPPNTPNLINLSPKDQVLSVFFPGGFPGSPQPYVEVSPDNRIPISQLAGVLRNRYEHPPTGQPRPNYTVVIQSCFAARAITQLHNVPGVSTILTSSGPTAEASRKFGHVSPFVNALVGGLLATVPTSGNLGRSLVGAFLGLEASPDQPQAWINGTIITKAPRPPTSSAVPCESSAARVGVDIRFDSTPSGSVTVTPPGKTVDQSSGQFGIVDICYNGPVTVTLQEQPATGAEPYSWTLSSPQRIGCQESGGREGTFGATCTIQLKADQPSVEAVPVWRAAPRGSG
jgi:hypothetical protein